MKEVGFTDAEFAKLKEAQDKSNGLVKTETIAMNAVKGLFEDSTGNFTRIRNSGSRACASTDARPGLSQGQGHDHEADR